MLRRFSGAQTHRVNPLVRPVGDRYGGRSSDSKKLANEKSHPYGGPMTSNIDAVLLDTEVRHLHSNVADAQYKIYVGRIGSFDSQPPVVLFLPDAETTFGLAMNTLWSLEFAGYVPPMLVIGIGYPVEIIAETYSLRSRDLTPTIDPLAVEKWKWEAGGAARFLEFIRSEMKPWIAATFDVDPHDNAYFGFSFGGLFGSYVLTHQPDTFKRYGLCSPSLWYDEYVIFDYELEQSRHRDDLDAKVFFSVGEHEDLRRDQIHLAWLSEERRAEEIVAHEGEPEVDMVADMRRFVAALQDRHYPNLEIEYEVIAREFHMTGIPVALSRTLRSLFGAPG